MNTALIIIYILVFLELMIYSNKHGLPRGDFNLGIKIIDVILLLILVWWAVGWKFI